jgi:hypothetical protein
MRVEELSSPTYPRKGVIETNDEKETMPIVVTCL